MRGAFVKRGVLTALSLAVASAMFIRIGMAEESAQPEPKPVGVIGDPSGTGPMPAVAEAVASLRTHTLYHPADLPDRALPLLVWGNGACADNGLMYSAFLREIASHGFFIISLGYPRVEGRMERPANPPVPRSQRTRTPDQTKASQFTEAIDWATSATNRSDGPFFHKIDVGHIAVAGHSCGGLQAIRASADPRVSTSIIMNSGVLNEGPNSGLSGIQVTKDELKNYHAPVAYINGGPTDIAFKNSVDDVSRIRQVPVFFAYNDVGHGGTYWSASNGGAYAEMAAKWLEWQLKGDQGAAKMFTGPDCGYCVDKAWTVKSFVSK